MATMDAMTELVYDLDGSILERFFLSGESKVCSIFPLTCAFNTASILFVPVCIPC